MLNKSCFNNLKSAQRELGMVDSECIEYLQDQIIMQDYSTAPTLRTFSPISLIFPFSQYCRDDWKNSKKVVADFGGRSKYFTSEKVKISGYFCLG